VQVSLLEDAHSTVRSNGRAEGIKTQLAALTVRARGLHSAAAFIAMPTEHGRSMPRTARRSAQDTNTAVAGEPRASAISNGAFRVSDSVSTPKDLISRAIAWPACAPSTFRHALTGRP
jgi:hypothetical protein